MKSDETINEDARNATVFKQFFFNMVMNLTIPKYNGTAPRADDNISNPVLKAIFKCSNKY